MLETTHAVIVAVAGTFSMLSLAWSVSLVFGHLSHYSKPEHQKYIVRILFMPPIYAVDSWISLWFLHSSWAIFFTVLRDCYESYVIYSFFKLLVCYLGGKEAVHTIIDNRPRSQTWLGHTPDGPTFYRRCLQGILQYVLVKPAMALLAAVLQASGKYGDGEFTWHKGYLYILIINNISVSIALYYLALFYNSLKLELKPHSPVLKFMVIKGVIFFTFWQSVAIVVAGWIGIIPSSNLYSETDVAFFINGSLVCFEMLIAAIGHTYAFPYKLYKARGDREEFGLGADKGTIGGRFKSKMKKMQHAMPGALEALSDVGNQRDVFGDTVESVRGRGDFVQYQQFQEEDEGAGDVEMTTIDIPEDEVTRNNNYMDSKHRKADSKNQAFSIVKNTKQNDDKYTLKVITDHNMLLGDEDGDDGLLRSTGVPKVEIVARGYNQSSQGGEDMAVIH
eukprot:TRINITY_DN6141_c0_g1_i1.p1 TRINITY_DN6141_c0_g1~~TRINITY_DN6141_c0_g1_i1.p1  ORF type:complete len:448 (-),score=90.26 TRINITY_DN6141_c0_g1_i1:54-1397(-)